MYHSICSEASHKSNPSSVPEGYTDLYPGSCGRGYHVEGYHDMLAHRALVYPSQGGRCHAECRGFHLRGSLRDSWRAPEMEHLYDRSSVRGTCRGGLLHWGSRRIHKKGSRNGQLSRWGARWGTWKVAYLPGTYM